MSTVLIGSGGITIGSQTRVEVAVSPDPPPIPDPGTERASALMAAGVEGWAGRPTYAELPDDLGAGMQAWRIAGGLLYWWDGAVWDAGRTGSRSRGRSGGARPALTIGTVDEGAADASITGTAFRPRCSTDALPRETLVMQAHRTV